MINRTKLAGMVLISSAVLGMTMNTGVISTLAADTAVTTTAAGNQASARFQTSGTLTFSDTAMNGLELTANNTITKGVLHLEYDVHSGSVNVGDNTTTTVKLPQELNAFAKNGSLVKYIKSANFKYHPGIGASIDHNYTDREIYVEKDTTTDDTYLLKFDNPAITGIGTDTTMTVNFNVDLGQMVTDTQIRIPDAYDLSDYHFATTIVTDGQVIDWNKVTATTGANTIPRWQLDPGYQLQLKKPAIDVPVYDTDTSLRGFGVPGAHVVVYQGSGDDRVPIGEGTVDADGFFTITIPKQAAGITLSVTQDTGVGESPATTVKVQHKAIAIPKPNVDQPYYGDKTISGKGYIAGDTITITNSRSGQIVKAIVKADLSFETETLLDGWILPKDVLQVQESNATGDVSGITEATVEIA